MYNDKNASSVFDPAILVPEALLLPSSQPKGTSSWWKGHLRAIVLLVLAPGWKVPIVLVLGQSLGVVPRGLAIQGLDGKCNYY